MSSQHVSERDDALLPKIELHGGGKQNWYIKSSIDRDFAGNLQSPVEQIPVRKDAALFKVVLDSRS